MTDQNNENLLNLALDATEEEREKSLNLDIGYDPIEREWELIVKYSGSLAAVREFAVQVTELKNEYAIVVVRESDIPRLSLIPQVEYVEKPKRLYFQVENGRRASCINSVQTARFLAVPDMQVPGQVQYNGNTEERDGGAVTDLFGRGTLVAVLDSGIDYANDDFRWEDGSTRIYRLWDQTIAGNPPLGYALGTEYTEEMINEALLRSTREERRQIVPSEDTSGHGTAVAGIAAGNGRGSGPLGRGVASGAGLLIVKLGRAREDGFPRTTELMQALNYVVEQALALQMPVAVNISIGMTYGSHDGKSLLERFIDDISNFWKSVICIGTGNEAAAAGHTSGILIEGEERRVQLAVQEGQTTLNVQIWKSYVDQVDISLISPSGTRVGPIQEILGPQRFRIGGTEILLYYGEPSPYNTAQEIYLDFLPTGSYVTEGVWEIALNPVRIVEGIYEMWLPSENVLNRGTGFLLPNETLTLTIPSTADRVISVGAYDARTLSYAEFSGRGYTRVEERVKPDLVAPGVNVTTTAAGGGTVTASGTSFATPFVTGGAALLMEWGIVRGNDSFLYGEKVKAYLRRGARPLPGFTEYPNPQVGYGALCVRDSIPG
ncbi:S8 family peptidase [Roseburia hominis]